MNIIITLAGHSRRFKEQGYNKLKFLIEIGGKPIISHVVQMFEQQDKFHFVLNKSQTKEYPDLVNLLKSLAKKVEVIIIPTHEKGPVFSALQVKSIADEDKVIISYCDFLVEWNYQNFIKEVEGYDGAVPSFKGFHPASFGNTYYAYMRVNKQNEMLELREKNSFTDKRYQEPASSGIYYFRHWKIFKKYAEKIMQEGFENLKEGYVSLLFNPMVKDNLKVLVNYVDKFICLGTPEDLEQYLFWSNYFNNQFQKQLPLKMANKQINLIPMAGKGRRFKEYGYRISKPLIQICKTPMVVKACKSFPFADEWVFLPRSEDLKKFPIKKTLENNFKNSKIIPIEKDTSGQAATCLLAKSKIDPKSGVFIASADYETSFSLKRWNDLVADKTIDVAIWTYRIGGNLTKDPKAFAYCKTKNGSNEVEKIIEKDVISDHPEKDHLVVGSFWFRSAEDFFGLIEEVIKKDITVNGEHYIGNGINLMINQGKRVVIFDIEQWVSYGDPFELELFFYWEEFFLKKNNV